MAQKKPKKPARPAPAKKGVAKRKPVPMKGRAAGSVAKKPSPAKKAGPVVAKKPVPIDPFGEKALVATFTEQQAASRATLLSIGDGQVLDATRYGAPPPEVFRRVRSGIGRRSASSNSTRSIVCAGVSRLGISLARASCVSNERHEHK